MSKPAVGLIVNQKLDSTGAFIPDVEEPCWDESVGLRIALVIVVTICNPFFQDLEMCLAGGCG